MSRVSLIQQLYQPKRKSALEFEYDHLWAPPILSILTPQDVGDLYTIANSLRLSGKINRKYKMIDEIMVKRGFRKWNSGTNRVTYRYIWSDDFIAKIAIDRVGMSNNPAEFRNQFFLKPFCCKIFEVDPSGVIAFVERVNPISSIAEFASVADDVFNMMVTKIIGKYVADDLGTEKYMNYGVRQNARGVTFGPVVLDFPSVYPLDPTKLYCTKIITDQNGMHECHGEIDYDDGLNHLICTKCGAKYNSEDLALDTSNEIKMYSAKDGGTRLMKVRVVDKDGNVVSESMLRTGTYVAKRHVNDFAPTNYDEDGSMVVAKSIHEKSTPRKQKFDRAHVSVREQFLEGIRQSELESHKHSKKQVVARSIPEDECEPVSENEGMSMDAIIARDTYRYYSKLSTSEVQIVSKEVDSDGNVTYEAPETVTDKDLSDAIIGADISPEEHDHTVEEHVEAPVEPEEESDEDEDLEDDHYEEPQVVDMNIGEDESSDEEAEAEEPESWNIMQAITEAVKEAATTTTPTLTLRYDEDYTEESSEEPKTTNEDEAEEPEFNYEYEDDQPEVVEDTYDDPEENYNVKIKGVSNKDHKRSKKHNKNYGDMSDY